MVSYFVFSSLFSYYVYPNSKAHAFILMIVFVYDFTLHVFDYLLRYSFHLKLVFIHVQLVSHIWLLCVCVLLLTYTH